MREGWRTIRGNRDWLVSDLIADGLDGFIFKVEGTAVGRGKGGSRVFYVCSIGPWHAIYDDMPGLAVSGLCFRRVIAPAGQERFFEPERTFAQPGH